MAGRVPRSDYSLVQLDVTESAAWNSHGLTNRGEVWTTRGYREHKAPVTLSVTLIGVPARDPMELPGLQTNFRQPVLCAVDAET